MTWRSLVLGLTLALGCDPRGRASSSGRFVAVAFRETRAGHEVLGLAIEDGYGHTLLAPPERWRTDHRVAYVWDAQERLWLWSSDAGLFAWGRHDTPHVSGGGWAALTDRERAALTPPSGIASLAHP